MKVHVVTVVLKDGSERFIVDIRHADGRRQRHSHLTKREAEIEVEALTLQVGALATFWGSLTVMAQAETQLAHLKAKEMGTTPLKAVEILECSAKGRGRKVTVAQIVKETIQTARNQNSRARYVATLEWVLNRFAKGREQLPITRISMSDIEDWLGSQKGRDGQRAAVSTIIGLRAKLFALFAEAVRKEYIEAAANPMHRVLCPKLTATKQPFFKPPEFHDLLWVCRQTDRKFLGWLTLATFAGIRPEELEKLEWCCVDMDRQEIVIDEGVSKTRRRRIVMMRDCGPLKDWLLEADRTHRFVVPVDGDRNHPREMKRIRQVITRHRTALCERAGIKWHQDIPRKTACTYLLALHESEDKVALILGNSPKVMHQHYCGLVRREESEAFWALTPAAAKNLPIKLPEGGSGKTKPGKLI